MIKKIYRGREVDVLFGWSSSTRKRKIKAGEFPAPNVRLGPQMCGWTEEVLEIERERMIAEREDEVEVHAA
jgi:predicted DNA-binding transcriptional regulator AlpA